MLLLLCSPGPTAHAQAVEGTPTVPQPPGSEASAQARFTLDALSQTRDRPLFSPTRRPPPTQAVVSPLAPPPPPPPQTARPPPLTLVGFVRSEERGAVAVVLDTASRTSFSLRAGDTYQGWIVRSLEKGSVLLQNGADTVTLAFPVGPVGPGGPPQPDD